MEAQIRCAGSADLQELKNFLTDAGLGIEGLSEETTDYFLLMEDETGKLTGTLGIERLADNGLLRSLVVKPGKAQQDLLLLFQQAFQFAKEKQLTKLFLATNKRSAVPFFEMLGFQAVDHNELPEELLASKHIRTILTVDNSLFLKFSF